MGDDDDDHQQSESVKSVATMASGETFDDENRHHQQQIIEMAGSEVKISPEGQCLCNSFQCQQLNLSRELDAALDPKVIFQSPNQLDKVWSLVTNRPVTEVRGYLNLLSEYKPGSHCGLAWPQGYVAYRCRTCSNTLQMSLCADCFRDGDHEGHNYNMFKSRSGGVCDCGYSIMKESGHCKRHGKNAIATRSFEQIPESLLCVPRRSMPRLIHRLLIQLRRSHVDLTGETDIYLDFLIQLTSSNAIMRDLMIDAMLSEQAYSNQIRQLRNHPDKEAAKIVDEGLKKLKSESIGLKPFKLPWGPGNGRMKAFCDNLPITCFVDEIMLWVVVFEFPQKLICFLLSFLMNDKFKQVFGRAFVNYYPRIVMMLASGESVLRRHLRSDSDEQLSRRILQVSVQIYVDSEFTRALCEEEGILHTLIYCLRVAIEGSWSDKLSGVIRTNPIFLKLKVWDPPKVVYCDNSLIGNRHLGSFTEDLNAILDFEHEAIRLVKDRDLLNTWLEMLTYFQTMNLYKRELGEHTPFEPPGPQISVFTIESDFCLSPLWSILSHMKVHYASYTQSLLEAIHLNLSVWFYRLHIGPDSSLNPYYMSFHIPLHRMFAATLRHMIFAQFVPDVTIYNFLTDNQLIFGTKYNYRSASGTPTVRTINDFFKMLLLHPLQALTLYNETRSGMWTRNGLTTNNQAVTYVHCAYRHSTVDLDMFLLKYCASKLDPNYFIKILMSRFHAWKWLSFKSNILMSNASNGMGRLYHFNIRPEQITQMVEGSLVTILHLLTLNIHCNTNDRDQTKEEMVALISVMDRSYSYLVDMLPDRSASDSSNIDEFLKSLLDELTIYKPAQHGIGGNLQQGCYSLKPNVWNDEYNPLQVQYRFYQKRDYQMSLERFFQHAKLTGKLDKRYHPSALWPPLKVPQSIANFGQLDLSPMIECQTLVGLIFSIIYKNLYIVDVPDAIMAYAIHLLELSLRKSLEKTLQSDKKTRTLNSSFVGCFSYRELASCPAYFGSKGEAFIKGSTLYALFNNLNREPAEQDSPNLFPTVRHALDLAFDATWFPFKSVVDNCLVHIENVHSLPWKEFEAMVSAAFDNKDVSVGTQRSCSASTSSGPPAYDTMSWDECGGDILSGTGRPIDDDDNAEDEEYDEEEDDEDEDEEEEEEEEEEGEGEEEEEDDDDGDENEYYGGDAGRELRAAYLEARALRIAHLRSFPSLHNEALAELAELESMRYPSRDLIIPRRLRGSASGGVSRFNQSRRTRDRATNTLTGYWDNSGASSGNPTNINTQSSSASQGSSGTFAGHSQEERIETRIAFDARQGEIDSRRALDVDFSEENNQRQQAEPNQLVSEPSVNVESDIDDVEMITVIYEPNSTPTEWPQSVGNQATAVETARPSQSSPSMSSQTYIRGTSTGFIVGTNAANSGDHTYSAHEVTSMEVESLPETQYGALSLVPVQQHQQFRGENTAQSSAASQMYPENLVTERRAILASEPRPMIAGGTRPLALEALFGRSSRSHDTSVGTGGVRHQVGPGINVGGTGNRDERSLSDVDIQARFLGFFQSQLDSHRPNSRGFRQRQLARRGGYRGPVTPLLFHDPNNTHSQPARTGVVLLPGHQQPANEVQPHSHVSSTNQQQDARRSACTLLNKALSDRSLQQQKQHSRTRRPRKDRQHHGESLLTLLLRLHAKYSQKAKSYEYNDTRAQANADSKRSRIGDGVHFVTIVLDLVCKLDREMLVKIEQLKNLIWSDKEYQPEPPHERPSLNGDNDIGLSVKANLGASFFGHQCYSPSLFLRHDVKSKAMASVSGNKSDGKDPGGSGSSSTAFSAGLTVDERRKRAKEFQSKLMADFASKQRAFIEKYESSVQQQTAHSKIAVLRSDKTGESSSRSASAALDEEPINLSSKLSYREETKSHTNDCDKQQKQRLTPSSAYDKSLCDGSGTSDHLVSHSGGVGSATGDNTVTTAAVVCSTNKPVQSSSAVNRDDCLPIYECCICGVEGPSDMANPLGQVVLLQSTSIYGHSHMRPQSERRLPCEESECTDLREETYAKYLERRIDLLCEHFSESSWLDSINIGAEGGVHVQSCGHYLHIECHQSYIKSLDQEDRLRSRNDSDEFLCPVCRQLANSVLPILSDIRQPGQLSLAIVSSPELDDQIKLIGSLLQNRLPPNQKELRSSSSFCSHLTKATGPQYRLVRTNASMHSLFLFLTSIARTNLETEVIVRAMRQSTTTAAGHQRGQQHHHHQSHQSSGNISNNTSGNSTPIANSSASKRSCFKLLFHVLALNAQTLINDQWFTGDQIWSYLTHRIDEKNRLSVKPMNSEVPLLLRDPTAMLLQFLFAITNSLCYRANFTCLVQILFNLTVVQSVALVLSYMMPASLSATAARQAAAVTTKDELHAKGRGLGEEKEKERRGQTEKATGLGAYQSTTNDFQDLLASVGLNLGHLLEATHALVNSSVRYRYPWQRLVGSSRVASEADNSWLKTPLQASEGELEKIALIENRVKLACLPFLRAAAYLQHQLHDQAYTGLFIVNDDLLTDCQAIEADFSTLTAYLNLGQSNIRDSTESSLAHTAAKPHRSSSSLIRALKWPLAKGGKDAGANLIASWSAELLIFGAEFSIAARTLLVGRSLAWYRPSLMRLPRSFDDIFMFYYRKKCRLCNQVPKDVAICLVCGAPICFRVSCCKDRTRSRQTHSQHCGANTAVFLAVHTSSIVVIRGNRACVWGSVYLDAHDEEDNGLQRGKPLYLVQARYDLLEEQWLSHSFDHTCGKRWIYLHENQ